MLQPIEVQSSRAADSTVPQAESNMVAMEIRPIPIRRILAEALLVSTDVFIKAMCMLSVAERAGFEPAVGLTLRTLSRRVT